MFRWSLYSNFNLRLEVDALRRDLNEHLVSMVHSHLSRAPRQPQHQPELYHLKKARLEALEAFANAQYAISQLDPAGAFHPASTQTFTGGRHGPPRHRPCKRLQNKTATPNLKAITAGARSLPEKGAVPPRPGPTNTKIKVEPDLDVGSEGTRSQEKPMPLLQIKLENIKQEIED